MANPTTATRNGLLDLVTLPAERITVDDIAHRLALTHRWNGVTELGLSVAQHSLLVANQLPLRVRIYGLLHDAHEAYLGDITAPAERLIALRLPGFKKHLAAIKSELDHAIRRAFRVPLPDMQVLAAVHAADTNIAATEWARLVPPNNGPWDGAGRAVRAIGSIKCQPPIAAEADFRAALERELAARSWEMPA